MHQQTKAATANLLSAKHKVRSLAFPLHTYHNTRDDTYVYHDLHGVIATRPSLNNLWRLTESERRRDQTTLLVQSHREDSVRPGKFLVCFVLVGVCSALKVVLSFSRPRRPTSGSAYEVLLSHMEVTSLSLRWLSAAGLRTLDS